MNTLTGRKAMRTSISTVILLSLAFSSLGSGQARADDSNPPVTSMQVTPEPPAPPLPPNEPERGLIYDGLEVATDGPCKGLYRVVNTDLCTHGPDPAPEGVDIKQSVPPIDAAREPAMSLAQCDGDGTSGRRIQALYVRASDVPDRYNTYLASFRQWVADMDSIFQQSAAETGGSRSVRFVHDASCVPIIPHAVLSPTGDDTFGNMVSELQAQGYNQTDRKYVIFMDANVFCGLGNVEGDDQPGSANANNGGPSYGRTDAGCWGGEVPAHELMHNLGGVQLSAPHSSGGWHCVDEYDLMCYSDSPNYPPMQYICTNQAHDGLFDCDHDDYYSTNPPAGSYLATRWNAANSLFLIGTLPPPPNVSVVGAWTADGNWNPKTTFAPGDPIQWVIDVENPIGADAQIQLTYDVRGPNGEQVEYWNGTVTTGTGIWSWGLPGTVLSGLEGTHTFTGYGLYQGTSSQAATNYLVTSPPDDLIFADSFEDDDCQLSPWSSCVIDGGDLSFNGPSLVPTGSQSLNALIDDNKAIYVTYVHPNAEPRYRARFYFDPNSITMVSGNSHRIFYGYSGTSKVVLRVEFRRSSGNYQLRVGLLNDGSSWKNSSWFTISDAPHSVEFDWRASTAAGANNGGLTLWIDGTQKANLVGVDNDTWRIDRIRLGAVNGIDSGTRGINPYYFDAFESRRQAYIGPAASAPTPTDSATPDARPTAVPADSPSPAETPVPSNNPTPTEEEDSDSDSSS